MEGKLGFAIILVLCSVWQVYAQVNCTVTGAGRFPNPSDTTCKNYTYCVVSGSTFVSYDYVCPTTSLFNPSSRLCTTNYVCPTTTNNTTAANSTACTAEGFFSDRNSANCSSYLQCVAVNGSFVETILTCPPTTFYNPNTTLCESNYTCPPTAPFACTSAGRFANSSDTTCRTYFFCVLQAGGTFVQYQYTCPTTSVFSPTARVCTTSYTCPS